MSGTPRPESAQSFNLVSTLWNARRTIIFITLLGLVAGAVASFIITPRFRSEVVLFPAIANTPSKALFNEGASNYADLMAFGEEEDAQHLMQILLSDRIRERMAQRFDLWMVYEIPTDAPHKRTDLYEAYKEHVQVENTKFGTVRVRVEDTDAQRAADMANAIADEVDSVWSDMVRERTVKAYELVQREVQRQEAVVDRMSDSLAHLRRLGVHDYNAQSERLTQSIGQAIVKGDQRAVAQLDERLSGLAITGGTFSSLTAQLSAEYWRLGMWRTRLAQAEADLMSEIPHKFLMERALPYDKKSYPVRWLMTVMCGLSGLGLALLTVVVRNRLAHMPARHA